MSIGKIPPPMPMQVHLVLHQKVKRDGMEWEREQGQIKSAREVPRLWARKMIKLCMAAIVWGDVPRRMVDWSALGITSFCR
jgi:hypothetical protein